jgi:hypothetical protein
MQQEISPPKMTKIEMPRPPVLHLTEDEVQKPSNAVGRVESLLKAVKHFAAVSRGLDFRNFAGVKFPVSPANFLQMGCARKM